MDKVQFNNEVVTMRKTVKKVKVQVMKSLTRQIKLLRSRKGKPEELEKNKRRCDRLVEVVQAMKHWPPDDVTYSALIKTPTVKEVMETPRDKALSRLIKHPLFVKRLATFKDLVTPDLLRTKRQRKKVNKGKKTEASEEDDQTLTLRLKETEKQESDASEKNPSETGDDEDSEDESDEGERESFFISSEKGKSLENSNLNSNPSSDKSVTDSRRNKSKDVGDSSMTSSEDEDEDKMEDQDNEELDIGQEKVHKRIQVPKVDLPNQTTRHPKSRHIPGISAPLPSTQDPVRNVSSDRGRGRGIPNRYRPISGSNSEGPQKNMPPRFHQSFSNRGRGRGHANNSVSSFRGSGERSTSKLNNYQEKGMKGSLHSKNDSAPVEKNKVEQMHPSWLAKKNQRAGEKPVQFAGKKTTFSDG